MSYDYSENILVQKSAGDLLRDELGWDVQFAYNTEVLGKNGTFGRTSYHEILLTRYFQNALRRLNPWMTDSQLSRRKKRWKAAFPRRPSCKSTRKSTFSSGTASRHGEKIERSAGNEACCGDRLSKPGE